MNINGLVFQSYRFADPCLRKTQEKEKHPATLAKKCGANIKQVIRCTESTHFIDLSMKDKSADTCVSRLYIHVYVIMRIPET